MISYGCLLSSLYQRLFGMKMSDCASRERNPTGYQLLREMPRVHDSLVVRRSMAEGCPRTRRAGNSQGLSLSPCRRHSKLLCEVDEDSYQSTLKALGVSFMKASKKLESGECGQK